MENELQQAPSCKLFLFTTKCYFQYGGSIKKPKPQKLKVRIKNSFKKFKKMVETQLGEINWKKVGVFALALLLMVSLKGLLGPEAQIVAYGLVKFSAYA